MNSRFLTTRLPSKRPRTSISSIVAEPLNRPDSAISTSWQFCRLASTLPSTISLSQELISPDSEISRPTISFLRSLSLRRSAAVGRPGRALSPGRGGSAGRAGSGARGGGGRARRLHRNTQVIRRVRHLAILCLGSFAAEHEGGIPSNRYGEERPS